MNKIKTWLKLAYAAIAAIAPDKLLHRMSGAYICGIVIVLLAPLVHSIYAAALLGVLTAFVVGFIKDYIVDPLTGGTKELRDVLWTTYGALDVAVVVCLTTLLYN